MEILSWRTRNCTEIWTPSDMFTFWEQGFTVKNWGTHQQNIVQIFRFQVTKTIFSGGILLIKYRVIEMLTFFQENIKDKIYSPKDCKHLKRIKMKSLVYSWVSYILNSFSWWIEQIGLCSYFSKQTSTILHYNKLPPVLYNKCISL